MAHTSQPVHIFRFGLPSDPVGYTLDPSGANLPTLTPGQTWTHVSTIHPQSDDGPRAGPSMATVLAGIAKDGVYVAEHTATVTHGPA